MAVIIVGLKEITVNMKIIYNHLIPFPGFSAMAFCGIILARKEYEPLDEEVINHESIHCAQAKECGGWFMFYLKYLWFWPKYGYYNIPFEKEAYDNDTNLYYLDSRTPFEWKKYINYGK